MKIALPVGDITTVFTSCGRWDLLVQSIDTFLSHHDPGRFILVEDSADHAFASRVRDRYPQIELVLNDPRLGQHKAIDRAYAMIETPRILHLEDDWFFRGPMDIEDAGKMLDEDPSIIAVCFSVFKQLKLRHRVFGRRFSHGDRWYNDMRQAHRESYGYSFYPTLVRRQTWEEYGPFANFQNERAISRFMKENGLGVVHQLPGVGQHVGSGRSVFDPCRSSEKRRITGAFWRRLRSGNLYAPNE
jgi:hypothetical protein